MGSSLSGKHALVLVADSRMVALAGWADVLVVAGDYGSDLN